jgi:Ca-activated chloride channel family protein
VSSVYFAAPDNIHVFWLVLAVAVTVGLLERRALSSLGSLVSSIMQAMLVQQISVRRRMARLALLTACGAFLTLALMRPQVGLRFIETPRVGAEIMICLDVSNSMLAEDVAPNRLERAKAEIRDLLGYLGGDQVGLIAFAGRATVLSPMTPDFGFLRLVLDEAGPGSVTRGGTRLEEPIRKAIAGFGEAADVSRSILLITDGEDQDSFPLEAAKEAAERGIRILSVGFGDEAGSEIVITDRRTGARSALRDGDGNLVISRLDGELLRQMALATDGAYIPAGTGVLDLEAIYDRHIARLTRGRLDGQGRAVRDDTFQLAILLGLVCLIAAAAVGSRASPKPRVDAASISARNALGLLAPLLLSAALATHVPLAHAQSDEPEAAAAQTAAKEVATGPDRDEDSDADPRDHYNNGLTELTAGNVDLAEKAFERVRADAGADAEARYRATYNLGWVDVKRADGMLAEAPEQALEALQRAASWFQRAVDLRPGAEEPRYNLELVTRRAIELADQLRQQEDEDLLQAITAVLESQRGFIGGLAPLVDATAHADSPDADESTRRAFRTASAMQLEILSTTEGVALRAANELAAITSKSEEERTPEEAVQGARLSGFLNYVHRARERMGQARARMRRLEAERSYRRSAASLDELKRARDQLLEPVAILDQLLADAVELARQTSLRVATQAGLVEDHSEPPAWLTKDYLTDSQITLTERTDELYVGIEAGLQQVAASDQELPPEQSQFVSQIADAAPHLSLAAEAFRDASKRLHDDEGRKALQAQGEAITELATARESFLDLRRLIELLYETETQVSTFLTPDNADGGMARVLEYSAASLELQGKNLERSERIEALIEHARSSAAEAIAQAQAGATNPDGSEADPQALEQERQLYDLADQLANAAVASMHSARAMIEALEQSDAAIAAATIPATLDAVNDAVAKIAELRRLFFNLIEHLKDTARRQIELGDETEVIAALANDNNQDETAIAVGPLEPRQRSLAGSANQLSAALAEQSRALAESDAEASGQDPAQIADAVAKTADASGYVAAAGQDMTNAAGELLINPAPLATVRADQQSAVENLLAAIALLEPPPPPEQQEGQDEDQQEEEEEQQQGGEQEQQDEQPERNTDPSQMLQGVRDREAQRRADQAQHNRLQYDPVEKDW